MRKESALSILVSFSFSYMDGLAGILHSLTQTKDPEIGITTKYAVPTNACVFAFYIGVLVGHAGITNWNDIYLATYDHQGMKKMILMFDGHSGTLSKMGIDRSNYVDGLTNSNNRIVLNLNTLDLGMGAIFYDRSKFNPTV